MILLCIININILMYSLAKVEYVRLLRSENDR